MAKKKTVAKKKAAPKKTSTKKKSAKKKSAAEKSFEQTLWDTADKLRGTVESSEYKHVVLSLIFLKFVSDRFEARRQEIIDEGHEDHVDMVEFYTMKNVFYLPEESRWSTIVKQAKQDDIAVRIDSALHAVEKNNPSLKGALPDNYFSRMGIDVAKLAALIDSINNINTIEDSEEDVVGRVIDQRINAFKFFMGLMMTFSPDKLIFGNVRLAKISKKRSALLHIYRQFLNLEARIALFSLIFPVVKQNRMVHNYSRTKQVEWFCTLQWTQQHTHPPSNPRSRSSANTTA